MIDTNKSTVIDLISTVDGIDAAVKLFDEHVDGVDGDRVSRPGDGQKGPRKFFTEESIEMWLGVYDDAQLVAAVHAAPEWGYIDDVLPRIRAGEESADWLRSFCKECVQIHEIGVAPTVRGRGLGRLLLETVERKSLAHGVHFLNGFVDNRNGSAKFYARCDYIVGPLNEPLPPAVLNGMRIHHPDGLHGNWFFKPLGDVRPGRA